MANAGDSFAEAALLDKIESVTCDDFAIPTSVPETEKDTIDALTDSVIEQSLGEIEDVDDLEDGDDETARILSSEGGIEAAGSGEVFEENTLEEYSVALGRLDDVLRRLPGSGVDSENMLRLVQMERGRLELELQTKSLKQAKVTRIFKQTF